MLEYPLRLCIYLDHGASKPLSRCLETFPDPPGEEGNNGGRVLWVVSRLRSRPLTPTMPWLTQSPGQVSWSPTLLETF